VKSQIDAWKENKARCENVLKDDSIGSIEKAIQKDLLEKTINPIINELENAK
jgi:hypothetical protein